MVRKRIDCLVATTVLSIYSSYVHGPIGGDNASANARVDQSVSRISRTQSRVLIDSNTKKANNLVILFQNLLMYLKDRY